jgi:colanic acid/amylovoran biosynthesis glycosyltransferase
LEQKMGHLPKKPIVLQRMDQFVGRTTNWLYDHLRHVPRFEPVIVSDRLANRQEFPEMRARAVGSRTLGRRLWRRLALGSIYPLDARWVVRLNPAALHSHFGYVAVGDYSWRKRFELPWVVSFYGADVYQLGRVPEWQRAYKELFSRADLILALGPKMADTLEKLGCPAGKVQIHALGVDTRALPRRRRTLRPDEPMRLLFAGTLREKKGLRWGLEGTAWARRRGVRLELHIVGDATDKPGDLDVKLEISDQIRRLGLADVVVRRPFLTFQELLELALHCHLFLAPSVVARDGDAEGTPFVLQQMMATAMPVIATHHSDIPFLFGALADTLVPERDAEAIAGRIESYAADPSALARDGDAVRQQMVSHFDLQSRADSLAIRYDALLSQPPADPRCSRSVLGS